MKMAICTSVIHVEKEGQYYGYGPYVREMNLWGKFVEEIIVIAPKSKSGHILPMDLCYDHPRIKFVKVPSFNITNPWQLIRSLIVVPYIMIKLAMVMRECDHMHFRCPSNMGLVGCIVQLLFPSLKKSAKFAGNWDPNSDQPRSYRIQKWLLSNTFLTRNIKVLVYGEWPGQTTNIVPFISATFRESEKMEKVERDYTTRLKFVFIGALVVGKRPLLTIDIVKELNNRGYPSVLHMFGEGDMMDEVKEYVASNKLEEAIQIHGNQDKDTVKEALYDAHFNILPSKSEGWPKAVAEGMFFGAIPVSTRISCLEWMLDKGNRGILIEADANKAADEIINYLNKADLQKISNNAMRWSQKYTLDELERAIERTLKE